MAIKKRVTTKTIELNVFIKELRALEQRLDTRFEIQTESLKAYVDSRFSQVNAKFDSIDKRFDTLDKKFDGLEKKVDKLDKKLDVRVDGLVKMIESIHGDLINHEGRISTLEARA